MRKRGRCGGGMAGTFSIVIYSQNEKVHCPSAMHSPKERIKNDERPSTQEVEEPIGSCLLVRDIFFAMNTVLTGQSLRKLLDSTRITTIQNTALTTQSYINSHLRTSGN
jgi:hypothetical protein